MPTAHECKTYVMAAGIQVTLQYQPLPQTSAQTEHHALSHPHYV